MIVYVVHVKGYDPWRAFESLDLALYFVEEAQGYDAGDEDVAWVHRRADFMDSWSLGPKAGANVSTFDKPLIVEAMKVEEGKRP